MTDVTFIGLGLMGAALARASIDAGYDTTVWNRTAEKADDLVSNGAIFVSDVVEAIRCSPTIIVCVGSYEISDSIIKNEACVAALKGKTLVQLTSGSAGHAAKAHDWITETGARYIDGGIESYPEGIGTDDSMIIISGNRRGFDDAEPVLRSLAPVLHYLGDDPSRASAMYSAMLSSSFGLIFGVMHAVAICEATGITMKQYLDVLTPVFKSDISLVSEMALKCEEDNLSETQAYLSVWNETLGSLVDILDTHQLNSEVPTLMHDMLNRAEKAGYGNHDLGALIKMIRK